jgi:hypothetical protein
MEKHTEKLEESVVEKLRQLNTRKNELIINTGQVHLDISELERVLTMLEVEFQQTSKEMNIILSDFEKKYPNGEIDLVEGIVVYQK